MKIMPADDRLLFREKMCNKQVIATLHFTLHFSGHVSGQSTLIGASHG